MSAIEVVTLRGGTALPLTSITLALDLELRGISLGLAPDGTLFARPRALITDDDVQAIRDHREDLKAIVRYCMEAAVL